MRSLVCSIGSWRAAWASRGAGARALSNAYLFAKLVCETRGTSVGGVRGALLRAARAVESNCRRPEPLLLPLGPPSAPPPAAELACAMQLRSSHCDCLAWSPTHNVLAFGGDEREVGRDAFSASVFIWAPRL